MQFGHFIGLQTTLFQYKTPLRHSTNIIQILHVNTNHWAVMSTLEADKRGILVLYYDSIYSAIPEEAKNTIAGLVPQHLLNSFQLRVESMATQKQAGVTDCGLYAIAICTS